MTNTCTPRLLLGDRPRLDILLDASGPLPVRLLVELPGPQTEDRIEGKLVADPRLPETEITMAWSSTVAVPDLLARLTLTMGDQSWTLEQDIHNPERWLEHGDPDERRHWS